MKKCSDCVWCIHEDYGYSNYTVEGKTLYCAKFLNPEMPFDRWFGEDGRDLLAGSCGEFARGDSVYIDCEREEYIKSDDPDVAWSNYTNGSVTGKMIEAAI